MKKQKEETGQGKTRLEKESELDKVWFERDEIASEYREYFEGVFNEKTPDYHKLTQEEFDAKIEILKMIKLDKEMGASSKESERGIAIVDHEHLAEKEMKTESRENYVKFLERVADPAKKPTFLVNGETYTPKVIADMNISPRNIKLWTEVTKMFYLPFVDPRSQEEYLRERRLPQGTDIIKEYGRIQLKQSKLSAWERDRVVNIFERHYVKLESNE